jgi:TonB-dependent SusC/RagA subfamily outer membrane receptor
MRRAIFTLVIILTLSNFQQVYSQREYFDQINKELSRFSNEKIYLHTDRNIYSSREDIWFKIYLLDGKSHVPLAGVNDVYVDLVNSEGEILIHKPFFIDNGTGNGNFTIGDTLESGVYSIYAYTNYMQNFGFESFFEKKITISQIQVKSTGIKEESQPGVSLQFMPEGGYLSNNITNTLAFKITSEKGKGVNMKGTIMDQSGQSIRSFNSTHLGMGKINFTPQPEKQYYAVLEEYPSQTFQLPPSYNKPQLKYLGVRDSNVRFMLSDQSTSQDEKRYYIAIKAKGSLNFYLTIKFYTSFILIEIPEDDIQSGLNQAILFDKDFVPLAERLFYLPGAPRADLNIQLAREIFKPREKTEVRLKLLDQEEISLGGSFSMAAVNLDQIGVNDIPLENIVSYLELSSEIRGPIENPGYYFSEPNDSVKENLDLLLLSQGWTKYIWDEQFVASLPKFRYQREVGFTIAGHAQKLFGKSGLQEGKITLTVPEASVVTETTTDSNGYFHFDNIPLFDSTEFFIRSRDKRNRKNSRLIDANLIVTPPYIFPELKFPNPDMKALESYNKNASSRYVSNSYFDFDKSTILIEEVTIVKEKEPEEDGNLRLYSEADDVVDMDDYKTLVYTDFFTFVQGMSLPGVSVVGDEIYIRNADRPALIILDGMVLDNARARAIVMQDVDKIEVLKDVSAVAYGVRGANGVVVIYTKRGEIIYHDPPTFDVIVKSIEGYAKAKEFYMPDYDNPESDPPGIDHRATVFWAPFLSPDTTGICTVSFHNSDDVGKVAIIVEGILSNGTPGQTMAFYWVKRE